MVAAGVPRERPGHAAALVQLALDMREAVASRTFGDQKLALRTGINSGPVVAGVVGRKKFIYDLGRGRESGEPCGIPGPERDHPDLPEHLRSDQGPIRLRIPWDRQG
jgi:hypothetical protein